MLRYCYYKIDLKKFVRGLVTSTQMSQCRISHDFSARLKPTLHVMFQSPFFIAFFSLQASKYALALVKDMLIEFENAPRRCTLKTDV